MPDVPLGNEDSLLLFKKIGWRIRVIRKAHGAGQKERKLTQEKLGASINLSKSFISLVEAARSQASISTLVSIAFRLHISIGVLLGESIAAEKVIQKIDALQTNRRIVTHTTGSGKKGSDDRKKELRKIDRKIDRRLKNLQQFRVRPGKG